MKIRILKNYYFIYLCAFSILFLFAFFWFFINGKSFISNGDGIQQHYNSLVYFGQYVREIIITLLSEHRLVIPKWDFSLGMGADIYTTLHYYAIGDPLNLLYVVTPTKYSELLYDFLFILRLFLAGLTFSVYMRSFKKSNFSVLCGSLIYLFCAYVFAIPVVHPYFLNPMIYLPLLLLGIEKIYSNRSPILFVITVFVSAVSNFYFFYMLSILIFLYACIRFFSFFSSHIWQNICIQLRNFVFYYLIGTSMAGAILFPVIVQTLNTGRIESKPAVDLFYDINYYKELLSSFMTSDTPGYYTLMGFGCIPLIIIPILFIDKRKKSIQFKIGFLLCILFILLPIFGSALNGFSYVTNRWIFAFGLVVSIIVTCYIEELYIINTKKAVFSFIFSVIYIICMYFANEGLSDNAKIMCMLLLFTSFAVVLYSRYKSSSWILKVVLGCSLCLGILLNSYFYYSPTEKDYTNLFVKKDGALSSITESMDAAVPESDEHSFWRYGNTNSGQSIMYNAAALSGKKSTSAYYSLINGNVTDFSKEILSFTSQAETKYAGYDERTIPQALASTKYYVVLKGKEQYLPYGFTQKASTYTNNNEDSLFFGCTYDAYINDFYLPFGYTYDTYIDSEDWKNYNFLEKQEAMLQSCYIEEGESNITHNDLVNFSNEEIRYEVIDKENVDYLDGKIIVNEPKGTLTFTIDGMEEAETYIYFSNLQYQLFENSSEEYPSDALINVKVGDRNKQIKLYTQRHNWYNGIHDFAVNLGYEEKPQVSFTLEFTRKGIYTFDQFAVYGLPLSDNYEEAIEELGEEHLSNIYVGNDEIRGDIEVSDNKILCLSIPYDQGWTAYVDGKETDLVKCNIMYTGLKLQAGYHNIVLKYNSKNLNIGIVISILGLIGLISIIVKNKLNR